MTLKSKLMLFTAAVAFSASMAGAAITADDLITTYQNAAFTSIQVTEGPTQIKVEAVKNGVKLEVIYDKETGVVIKRERTKATRAERSDTGVEVSTRSDDFADGTTTEIEHGRPGKETHLGNNDGDHIDGSDDDGSDHDASDDNGSDVNSDDGSDVNSDDGSDVSSDDGASHDMGDDNGSDDNDHDDSDHDDSDHDDGDNHDGDNDDSGHDDSDHEDGDHN